MGNTMRERSPKPPTTTTALRKISALTPGTKIPYVSHPNYDLSQPIEDIKWDAEKGILYWGPEGPVTADD